MKSRKISDIFIESNSQHNIVENPLSVILQTKIWTGGDLYLTELILSQIISTRFQIANGEEEERV